MRLKYGLKGFTLIELMIVVAVIGILASIAIPKFAELLRKSREGSTKGNLGALRSAINVYYTENEGWFPTGSDTFQSNVTYLKNCLENRYVKDWPSSYVPPYHGKTGTVDNYPELDSSNDPTCDGEWGYCGSRNNASWGHIFVECWSTDMRGVQPSTW